MNRTVLEVDPDRVLRWLGGFAELHGGPPEWAVAAGEDPAVLLQAPDGTRARVLPWAGPADVDEPLPQGPLELARWVQPPHRLGLVLLRWGGYAIGTGRGEDLTTHRFGTRQRSGTAVGRWAPHRVTADRPSQVEALVRAVRDLTARLVGAVRADLPEGLVVGGDRHLVGQVLADPRLADLARLPRRELYDLPDREITLLERALRRGRAARVVLSEPANGAPSGGAGQVLHARLAR